MPSGQARRLRGHPADTAGSPGAIPRGARTLREPLEVYADVTPGHLCLQGPQCPAGFRPAHWVLVVGASLLGLMASPHRQPLLFQELLLEFKSEMQKREHGFRQQADSLSSVVSTHELKVGDGLSSMTAPSPDTRCRCWAQEGGLHTEASLAVLGSGVMPTVVPATWPFS